MKRLLMGCLMAAGLVNTVQAQERELRVSLWIPPTHATVKAFEDWGKSLSDATGGTIKVTLFPAEQLGKAVDQYDMARDGIAEMTMVAPAYNSGQFPIFLLDEVPFIFSNSTKGVRALHEWYLKYVDLEMPDVKLCTMTMHHPATLHMKSERVTTPDQLKGKKLRVAGTTSVAYVTGQGATTVQAALPEVRELVERGVVDGITFPWDLSVINSKDSLKFHLDLPIYAGTQAFVMNKPFYEAMTPEQKAAVDAHCTPEWSEKLSTAWAERELKAREALKADPAHEVYTPTAEEAKLWVAAADDIREKAVAAVSRFNLDGNVLLDELKAKLKDYGAGY